MNVKLIVPNCNRSTSPIVAYGPTIAAIAGGFTATQATGGWIDETKALIVEPVTVFDCTHQSATLQANGRYNFPKTAAFIAAQFCTLAKQVANDLHQTCVFLQVDGNVELVTP